MTSGTRGLEDRSTSGSISSTNHLSPLLRTRGSEGLFGTLWRSLTSSTSASCNRTRISANSKLLRRVPNHSVDPHVKISCHQVHPRRLVWSNQAPVYCGCPAGTHGCDLVSSVRPDQSANPVVVWLGLVSRVVRSSWRRGAFVN